MTDTGGHGHGHGGGTSHIVMKRADGKPLSKAEVIVKRRGAFIWLPVLCSNDLVHGSWWFTWGSLVTTLFAVYPLVNNQIGLYRQEDDVLPATDYDITWAMLIVSGIFFTLGSLAFVHAFEEPTKPALFYWYKHLQTDELLGAWLFLIATVPAVPYMLVFFMLSPSFFYFMGLCAAVVFVFGSCLFVAFCYPSEKKHENVILPLFISFFGARMLFVKHLANDWLSATWFFFWANAGMTFGSFLLLFTALVIGNSQQIFIWMSGTVSTVCFQIGSFYFVSGSYPHAQQFYYATGRGRVDTIVAEDDTADGDFKDEEGGLGIGLRPSKQRRKLSFSGSMQRMRVAVNVQTLNSMVTSPLHISKEKLQRLGSKALFRKEKSSGEDYRFPRPPADQTTGLPSQGGARDGDVHNPLWEQKTRDIVHEDNDDEDDDDEDDEDVLKAKPNHHHHRPHLNPQHQHQPQPQPQPHTSSELKSNTTRSAVQAPAAAASSSSSSSAHVQHNVSAASTQPSVPPAPVPAPAAVPAAALVATTVPVQPIVSQPPLRKPRPPPREGEDRAIPIHLVPIRRVDMVPVLADHPPPAPVLAPVPAATPTAPATQKSASLPKGPHLTSADVHLGDDDEEDDDYVAVGRHTAKQQGR